MQLILLFTIFSINVWADTYHYRADVKGMVCAFCVYSVGKNIRKLPGVIPDSVNVSLKDNLVTFNSKQKVSEKEVSALFNKSGFSISHLTVSKTSTDKLKFSKHANLDLNIDVFEINRFTSLLRTVGDIASKKPSLLRIKAPQGQEDTILKALLMGRKQVIQVYFIPDNSVDTVHLQLFNVL